MIRALILALLRPPLAWLGWIDAGHDDDTELTDAEASREVWEPDDLFHAAQSHVSSAPWPVPAPPDPPSDGTAGTGHPNPLGPLFSCPICGTEILCREALLDD